MSLTYPSIYILITSVFSIGLAVYSWKNREHRSTIWLSILFVAISVWSAGYALQLSAPNLELFKVFNRMAYLGIALTPVSWFLFSIYFSNREKLLTGPSITLLLAIPIFSLLAVFTNDFHQAFHAGYETVIYNGQVYFKTILNTLFWVHAIFNYIIIGIGVYFLIRTYAKTSAHYRISIRFILAGTIVPTIVNIFDVSGYDPFGFIDATPFAFLLMAILITVGIHSKDIFKITPLALDTLFNSMSDAIFVFDNDKKLSNTNQSARHLLKRAEDEQILLDRLKLYLIPDIPNQENIDKIPLELDLNNQVFEITTNDINNRKGKKFGTLIILRDITFEKLTHRKLAQSQLEYQTIFEQASDAIFIIDKNTLRYKNANKKALEIIGYTLDELKTKTTRDLAKSATSKDKEILFKTGTKDFGEIVYTRPNGTKRVLLLNANLLDDNIIVAFAKDITLWKKMQEDLVAERNLFSSGPVFTIEWYFEEGFPVKRVSQNITHITGYQPEDFLKPGFKFTSLLHPDDLERAENEFYGNEKNRVDTFEQSYRLRMKNGEYRWFYDFTKIDRNANDEIIAVRGYLFDQTALIEAEKEKEKARELEQQIILARKEASFKQTFLATMSHEIRTPLTGVLGMAEILSHTSLKPKQADYVNTLIESGENLRNIINLILDYSKLEAGQMQLNPTAFHLKRFMDNTKNLFDALCNNNVTLSIEIDRNIPEYIVADRPKVSQVISNLLSNAIKFTPAGEIKVLISMEPRPESQNTGNLAIKIDVMDSGVGIDEKHIKNLFKPFYQASEALSGINKGTGLGLSISKQLTLLMGGDISVTSVLGKGSTFSFSFFATQANESDLLVETNQTPASLPYQKALQVLAVEDMAINRKVIEIMLSDQGHKVTFAHDGLQALKTYRTGLFDLILMDINMPVINGVEATRKLKENYTNLPPIVGLSANAFEGDREKYLALGMDDYLTKPVKGTDFQKLINRLFAK
jgi:PAS domain S-box-containing protein